MRIFILSHDLSHNCLGRAVLLAQVYGRKHEVHILGPSFGPDIWFPCRDSDIKFRKVEGELFLPQYTHLMARLLDKIKGQLVIAVKPRPTSFGLALMDRALSGRPVLLDIDDDEMAFYPAESWRQWDTRTLLRRPNSPLYTAMLEQMIPTADAITCASTTLQSRYGGALLPHAKDPAHLDPDRYDRELERQKRDLPLDEKIIVFAGSPRPHKGLELLLSAIRRLERADVRLLIVGCANQSDNPYEEHLRQLGGEHLYLFKQCKLRELPGLLAVADLVVLPQTSDPVARAQMPSKLFDAMAMRLPIIASDVSDITAVLAEGCGIAVPPDDEIALTTAIAEVLESPNVAQRLGINARQRLIERFSIDAVQATVDQVLAEAMKGGSQHAIPS